MILEKQKIEKREVLVGNDGTRIKSKINAKNLAKVLTMLADIYKDRYGTIPLEYLSNSWDSHLESNKEHVPIVCQLKKDVNDKWFFAAIDYGVGISPDRINNFVNYGDSTKDEVDMFTGALNKLR